MPTIVGYSNTIQILLIEFGKYFGVFLLSVLCFRTFRSSMKMPAAGRRKGLLLAGFIGLMAIMAGYCSIQNSMGIMYLHYGNAAFDSGRLEQAYDLYDSSAKFWDGADATGRKGVCLFLSGATNQGEALLERASMMRHGKNTSFEQFYKGLYYLINHQDKQAVLFLSQAAADNAYNWTVVKYFAALDLDYGDTQSAATRMEPYLNADITDGEFAYIIAALDVANGKPDAAKAVLDKFSPAELTPFWKVRFEKLQAQINQTHP